MTSLPPKSHPVALDGAPEEWLSALADGDCDSRTLDAACRLWREDDQARRTWHAYHLIGDVMRSDDLASLPRRDAAFLAGVRARLAVEPVPLAPASRTRRHQPWLVPAAMAAGFVAVAGVLLLVRSGQPTGASPRAGELAAASSPAAVPAVAVGGGVVHPVLARSVIDGAGMLRDPRLDEFLRAHQAVGPGMTMAVPGGTLRRVDIVAPADSGR
jgi:sigma-E factor negative regulatory protein RseA